MILVTLLFLALGGLADTAQFVAIWYDARYRIEGGALIAIVSLGVGRLVATVLVLLLAAFHGWPALLAAVAGFMSGRHIVMHRLGRAE